MSELPMALVRRIADEIGLKGPIHPIGKPNQNNWNWQVGSKVLKIFIPNEEDPLEETPRWKKESLALSLVGPQGFAPTLLMENVVQDGIHVHVREYVPGKTMKDLGPKQSHLEEVANILHRIHTTHLKSRNDSIEGPLEWYIHRCERTLRLFRAGWALDPIPTKFPPSFAKDLFKRSMDSIRHLMKDIILEKLSLVHGDLLLANIIWSDVSERFVLIDWEYSGYRDPAADISYFISQNPNIEPYREYFLGVYLACAADTEDNTEFRIRLKAHDLVLDWIFALWCANRALEISSGKRVILGTTKRLVRQIWNDYETRISRIVERAEKRNH